jgi:simple sugar transport system permease protein
MSEGPDVDDRRIDQAEGQNAAELAEARHALEQQRWDRLIRIVTPFVSVAIALLIGSLFILASGSDPVAAFSAMFTGAFGSQRAIGETLIRATPIIFTGLAVGFGFRAGLFNIGAEGQLFLGGLAAAYLGVQLGSMPWYVSLPVAIVGAALAGAAWAFIPALLKARTGAHEVITTMMFTYIGRYLVDAVIVYLIMAPGTIPQTAELSISSRLPRFSDLLPFLEPSRGHTGFVLGVAAAIAVWAILRYTTFGSEARAVGFNPSAAESGGISVSRMTIKALCFSGGLAGLAGAVEVMGVHFRLFSSFSPGFGFTGIAVALLAKNNPLAMIASALLFGAMQAGAGTMQLETDVSPKVVLLIQGIIVFLVGAETIVTWSIGRLRRRREVVPVAA